MNTSRGDVIIGIGQDITQRKKAELDLIKAKKLAESACLSQS